MVVGKNLNVCCVVRSLMSMATIHTRWQKKVNVRQL